MTAPAARSAASFASRCRGLAGAPLSPRSERPAAYRNRAVPGVPLCAWRGEAGASCHSPLWPEIRRRCQTTGEESGAWPRLLQLDDPAVGFLGATVDARLVGTEEAQVLRQLAQPLDVGPGRAPH